MQPIFDHFREILYPRKVSKTRNLEIKYPRNEIPAEFEIFFFLIFDQNMILLFFCMIFKEKMFLLLYSIN